jgi:2'-5' RNA ligase
MTMPTEETTLTAVTDPDNVDLVLSAPEAEELTAAGDNSHNGMIALIPTVGNAERLMLDGGEYGEDLHCTVIFLGDIGEHTEESFNVMLSELAEIADEETGPVVADGFNVSLFNPHNVERDTCITLGLSGAGLHDICRKIRERVLGRMTDHSVAIPEQHEPWIPHVTLAYTDDHSLVESLADRTGDITFDRIRLAMGDEVYDFDLTDNFEAADAEPVNADETYDDESYSTEQSFTMRYNDRENEVMNVTQASSDVASDVQAAPGEVGAWSGVLIVEGVESGDGRMFAEGSLRSAPLPLPLMWQKQTDEGHKTAVQAGRIDELWRENNEIWGRGVFDLEGDDGAEAYRQVEQKFLRGVSGDVDSVKDSDVELVFPKSDAAADAEGFGDLFAAPELTIFHRGRLRGATLVQFPAFVEASIALEGQMLDAGEATVEPDDADFAIEPRASASVSMAVESSEEDDVDDEDEDDEAQFAGHIDARAELTACGCTDEAPPREWFDDPKLAGPTPLTVTEDGRIYGHAAVWGTCHTGFSGQCVTPPRERFHEYFMLGETLTADGNTVATGTITLGTGHASTGGKLTAVQAIDHYDHTGAAVADVVTGEDQYGLWFSGALRPNLSPLRLRTLRAAKLSGDWRRFGNGLRLIALLAVNVPGFPVPRVKTAARRGVQTTLVAAGVNPYTIVAEAKPKPKLTQSSGETRALQSVIASLKNRVGRDDKSRMDEIRNRVRGR